MKVKYTFLGAGNMASAIIRALNLMDVDVCIYDKISSAYDKFEKNKYKIAFNAVEGVEYADYIVLSVKPQNFDELLTEIKDSGINLEGKVFVSIGAGITISFICAKLGHEVPCIRTMPNTPLLIGKGITAITRNSKVNDSEFNVICNMFSELGEIIKLDETQMNAVISVTSSAPAYVYLFIKAINDSAKAQGFENPEILNLICKMVIGSASMVLESGKTPDELIKMVTSPHGTTEKAMNVFNDNDFTGIVGKAMQECTNRAFELSEGK